MGPKQEREGISCTTGRHNRKPAASLTRRLAYVCLAPIILLAGGGQPATAIFNCFKMAKGPGQFGGHYGGHPGERANWYGTQPQLMGYPSYGLGGATSYSGMSPMK